MGAVSRDPTSLDVVALAARALSAPIACLAGASEHDWLHASVGLRGETLGDRSLITALLHANEVVCEDAAADPRFSTARLPDGRTARFLLATTVRAEDGAVSALLLFADERPRRVHAEDLETLRAAARLLDARPLQRMKSEFVSVVSHELRTPLTSLRGALGILEAGASFNLSAEAGNLVRIARTNAERLIRLVNDILDIEKIEAGKLELHRRDVGAGPLIEQALEALRPLAAEGAVTFVAEVDPQLRLMVDEDRTVQLINNLVSNAIKFSPQGGRVILKVARRGPRTARLSVRDEGPGISADQVPRLFTRFQQLDASDRRTRGGSGLGLAISKAIVEQHGGTIGVETRPGEGATFYADLPAVAASSSRAVVLGPRRLVLLVGRGESLFPSVAKALTGDGFVTANANDPDEAARWLDNSRPACVVIHADEIERALELVLQLEGRFGASDLPRVLFTSSAGGPAALEWVVDPLDTDRMKHALRWRRPDARALRALLVEPDDALRSALARSLAHLGLDCVAIASGVESPPGEGSFDLLIAPASALSDESVHALRRFVPSGAPLLAYGTHEPEPGELLALAHALSSWVRTATIGPHELPLRVRSLLHGLLMT